MSRPIKVDLPLARARKDAKPEHLAKMRDFVAVAGAKGSAEQFLNGVVTDPTKAEELAEIVERNLDQFQGETGLPPEKLRWAVRHLRSTLNNKTVGNGQRVHEIPTLPGKIVYMRDGADLVEIVQLGPGGFLFRAHHVRQQQSFARAVMLRGASPVEARQRYPLCGVDSAKDLVMIHCAVSETVEFQGATVLWDSEAEGVRGR